MRSSKGEPFMEARRHRQSLILCYPTSNQYIAPTTPKRHAPLLEIRSIRPVVSLSLSCSSHTAQASSKRERDCNVAGNEQRRILGRSLEKVVDHLDVSR